MLDLRPTPSFARPFLLTFGLVQRTNHIHFSIFVYPFRCRLATNFRDRHKAFIAWLSQKSGKTYRLPSEAEWEYAARAGTEFSFWWGRAPIGGAANCEDCNPNPTRTTLPSQSFRPNGFGLFDVAGNAVEDCWNDTYRARRQMVRPGPQANADNAFCAAAPCKQIAVRPIGRAVPIRSGRALLRQWVSCCGGLTIVFINARSETAFTLSCAEEYLRCARTSF